jgi:hypothetical protein
VCFGEICSCVCWRFGRGLSVSFADLICVLSVCFRKICSRMDRCVTRECQLCMIIDKFGCYIIISTCDVFFLGFDRGSCCDVCKV